MKIKLIATVAIFASVQCYAQTFMSIDAIKESNASKKNSVPVFNRVIFQPASAVLPKVEPSATPSVTPSVKPEH